MERLGNKIPSFMAPATGIVEAFYNEDTGMEYTVYGVEGDESLKLRYVESSHEDVGLSTYWEATLEEVQKLSDSIWAWHSTH